MRKPVTWRRANGSVIIAGALVLTGCQGGVDQQIPIPPISSRTAATTSDLESVQAQTALSRDQAFFSETRLDFGSADTSPPPTTISEGARRSTVVIRGRIVGLTRNSGEFPRNPDLTGPDPTLVVHVRVLTTLSGSLPEGHPQVIKVARLGLGVDEPSLTQLGGSLPQGEQIWFLRWLGTLTTPAKGKATPPDRQLLTAPALFAMTHNELLLTQGPTGVSAPWIDPDRPPGFAEEAAKVSRLDDLPGLLP